MKLVFVAHLAKTIGHFDAYSSINNHFRIEVELTLFFELLKSYYLQKMVEVSTFFEK